jgi:DGQHR domain-containing protein
MKKVKYKEEGNKFHKWVETLLRDSGFKIIRSDVNNKGPDIVAEFKGTKIIVQCRYSPKGNNYNGLEDLVDAYSTKRKKLGAKKAVLALSNYNLPKFKEEKLEKWLIKDNVAIWTDNIMNNYATLAKSIGKFAAVQIISDLGIGKDFGVKPINIQAIKVVQHEITFYITKLNPEFLLQAAIVVRRTHDSNKLYQRYITKKRVITEIPEYIEAADGIFPNNVIIASNEKLHFDKGRLILPQRYGAFVVIDGQHRLYSFCNLKNEELRKRFELPITIFDGSKFKEFEQAKTFATINSNAKKVPSSLILELNKSFSFNFYSPREIYLLEKFKRVPYFKDIIKEYSDRRGTINNVTFCTAKAFNDLVKDGGIILKNKGKLSVAKQNEICYKYLYSFFKVIHNNFKNEWRRPSTYIFSTNKGYRALLKLFTTILIYTNNKNDERKYREVIKALKKSKAPITNKEVGSGGGEGAANDLAAKWSKSINDEIPNFDKSVITENVLKEIKIKKGDTTAVLEFLSIYGKQFEGILRGELAFIDITTLTYLKKYFPKIKEFHIIAGNVKEQDKVAKEKEKMEKNIEIIKLKKIHQRWLANDKFLLELNTDLKDDAIANSEGDKKFVEFTKRSDKISDFDERWKRLKEEADRELEIVKSKS